MKNSQFASMGHTGDTAACTNESAFRREVRDILHLDWSARDERIFAVLAAVLAEQAKAIPPQTPELRCMPDHHIGECSACLHEAIVSAPLAPAVEPEPGKLQDVADSTLRRIALQYGSTTRRDFRVIEIVLSEMEAKR